MNKFLRWTGAWCICIMAPVVMIAQNAQEGMIAKERNYTSFESPARKVISPEMDLKTQDKFKANPEYGVLPYNTQCQDCYELIAERTATTRFFVKNNSGGKTIYSQAGAQPINYQDANGNWRAIDPRMFPTENANVFEAANQPSPTRIDLNKSEVSIRNGSHVLAYNRNLKLYHHTENGKTLVASANWSKATVGSEGAKVQDIFPGIDLVVYVINGGMKTSFMVNTKPAYVNGYLLIEDDMQLPAGATFATDRAARTKLGYEGMLTVNDVGSAITLFEIGSAVGYDNSHQRAKEDQKFSYVIDGNKLAIAVPLAWTNDPANTYPLTIDPLVNSVGTYLQANILGSGGNGSGNFAPASACPYTLVVPTPANTTITDIRFNFDYIAQNGAWRSEGATDFLYGTCRSPATATFYWFCNVNTAGLCTTGVAGLSVFSDFQACVPAPQCAPYNMSFTMRFYDRWGTTCSNTWIGANSNWVMTVEGHTIETATVSVSASTICFGQSVSASAGAQYGVPSYSYNWSFNSSGTPSVGTGSPASISFPAPGTYTLYGFVTDGCSQTVSSSTVVTVNPLPSPTITPTANPICQGQSTTLNASGASTYTWSANAGGGTGSSATVTPPVGTTVYTVTGTQSNCQGSATTTITVNALPALTATATPTSICAGQTATLTAGGANTFTWSANEGGSSNNPTSVSPASNTTYTVTGTDLNGCSNSSQVSVNVTPSPTLVITPASATICAGSAVTATVSGAATYTWMPGGSTGTTLSVTPSGTSTYVVTGDQGGCQSTANFVVTVNPLPSLTVTANPQSICSGQSATLTASGGATYTWSANSGGGNGNPIIVSPSASTTYTVAGTQNGCTDSTTVTVNFGAQPTLAMSATDTTICNGQSTTISISGATSYTWAPSGSGSSSSVNPNTTTTYTVIGDNGGCSDTTMFTVNVNPTPTVTAVSSPTVVCAGQNDTLTASGGLTYVWSANAGSATTSTVVVNPGTTDTFTVTGTDGNGCSSTAMVTVNVNALPTVTVNSSTICAGQQTATLTASGASTYTWSTSQSGASITVSPSSSTVYTVDGTDANGCMNSSTATVTVNQPPTVSVNSGTICAGGSTTLTANGAVIYVWTPPTGLSSATGSVVTANPGTSTSYTVMGMDMNGCNDTAVAMVNVNPLPLVTAAASPTALCAGGSATLTAAGASTFTWSSNAGGSTNDTTSVTPSVTDTYTVIGTDGNGCVNQAVLSVTVNPIPSIGAVGSQTVCGGSPVSAISFGGTATVNWTNSNTGIGLAASGSGTINSYPAPLVSTQQTGVITATPIDSATGCSGSSQTFSITVNPRPVVSGTAIVDSALCGMPTGGVSGLVVTNGTPAYSYQWYSGGAPVTGATSVTLTNQPMGTYSLVVTDANMCTVGSGPYTVNGTPIVVASFSVTPTFGTAPLNVSFTNNSTGAVSYNWTFGNGQSSAGQNPSVIYTSGGAFLVTLTASNGNCSSTDTAMIYVDEPVDIQFPNVFSPNGDNINDEFGFVTSGITKLTCEIYNRWGQLVATLTGPTDKWDGKLDNGNMASEGTYFYTVIATSFDNKEFSKQGSLTLVK